MLSTGIRIHTNLLHVCIQLLCVNNANKRDQGTGLGVLGAGLTKHGSLWASKLGPKQQEWHSTLFRTKKSWKLVLFDRSGKNEMGLTLVMKINGVCKMGLNFLKIGGSCWQFFPFFFLKRIQHNCVRKTEGWLKRSRVWYSPKPFDLPIDLHQNEINSINSF